MGPRPLNELSPAELAAWNEQAASLGGTHLQTGFNAAVRQTCFGERAYLLLRRGGGLVFTVGSPVAVGAGDRPFLRLARPVLARLCPTLAWDHGPLSAEGDDPTAWVEAIIDAARRLGAVSVGPVSLPYLRPDLERAWGAALTAKGFTRTEKASFVLRFGDRSQEELWAGLHSEARRKVRRAEERGIEVRQAAGPEDWAAYEEIRSQTCRQAGIAHRPAVLRRTLEIYPPKSVRVYLAWRGHRLVAGQGVNTWNGYWRLFGIASADFARQERLPGSDLLQWRIIQAAAGEGAHSLDWIGANPQTDSGKLKAIDAFKAKWGGEVVRYGVYRLDLKPARSRLLKR